MKKRRTGGGGEAWVSQHTNVKKHKHDTHTPSGWCHTGVHCWCSRPLDHFPLFQNSSHQYQKWLSFASIYVWMIANTQKKKSLVLTLTHARARARTHTNHPIPHTPASIVYPGPFFLSIASSSLLFAQWSSTMSTRTSSSPAATGESEDFRCCPPNPAFWHKWIYFSSSVTTETRVHTDVRNEGLTLVI